MEKLYRYINIELQQALFLSNNIQYSPAYFVFISKLIRYARACSSDECFILRAVRLSLKLHGQADECQGTFEIISQEGLLSIWRLHQILSSRSIQNVT